MEGRSCGRCSAGNRAFIGTPLFAWASRTKLLDPHDRPKNQKRLTCCMMPLRLYYIIEIFKSILLVIRGTLEASCRLLLDCVVFHLRLDLSSRVKTKGKTWLSYISEIKSKRHSSRTIVHYCRSRVTVERKRAWCVEYSPHICIDIFLYVENIENIPSLVCIEREGKDVTPPIYTPIKD